MQAVISETSLIFQRKPNHVCSVITPLNRGCIQRQLYTACNTWRHGRRKGGTFPPWFLQISAKKGCFRSFEYEKTNFTTFAPP